MDDRWYREKGRAIADNTFFRIMHVFLWKCLVESFIFSTFAGELQAE